MIRITLHTIRLALTIRIDQLNRHQVLIRHRIRFRDSKRVFQDRLDRTPGIDDLVAAIEKLSGFGRQMMQNAVGGRGIGLIDVHPLYRAAEVELCFYGAGLGLAADGVVEDEDSVASGSAQTCECLLR
jgi:hypothetical protein